ncbi:efflux transporter outer membrane subunit [Pseudomonas sp. FME51]|uniref:efflux transporter outer membrane subunit n=1 Tax=Pseudomonas sp. FME51 TaxID=2742609 RepID=UPI00186907D7|nr:efflux transporter outer membrane subunit [Pseudomonas sp. FME51]
MNFSFYRLLPCIAMVAAVLTSACSVAPPAEPELPFALPENFSATLTSGYTPVERWWRDFGDEQLDGFVETALVRNPGVAQALARAQVAEARIRLNRADQLPQAGVGLNSARQRQNMSAMAGPLGELADDMSFISNNHNAALDVSWELDLWGRLSALSSAARAEFLASAEQLRGARQSVAAQVVQLYYEIVHARAQVELSERTVEALAEMSRQIGNRSQVGIASPADAMLAQANLGSAEAGLEQRREALARTLRQLDVLLGYYPTGTLQTADTLPSVPAAPAAGVPAQLLERRPDVRAAELALLAAGYQLGAAERSFLPSLSLSGSAGYASGELSGLFDSSNLVWSIAGQIMQPVFQGGRLVAQVDIAEGQQDEALYAYVETALNALAEVESMLAVDTVLARRESNLDASASAAEEAVHMSYNRYQQGIDPFLNVLESQQRALDGRSAHITARHARIENRITLHLALGGGFEPVSPGVLAVTPVAAGSLSTNPPEERR